MMRKKELYEYPIVSNNLVTKWVLITKGKNSNCTVEYSQHNEMIKINITNNKTGS